MEKSTVSSADRGSLITFLDTAEGMAAGFWHYAVGGYRWVEARALSAVLGSEDRGRLGQWLIAETQSARRYAVLKRPHLLEAMDKLAGAPTQERILSFANRWGALGDDELVVTPFAVRRDYGVVTGGDVTGGVTSGESLTVWQNHLLLYGDLRRLWRAVTIVSEPQDWLSSRVREAKESIESVIWWGDDGSCSYHSRYEAAGVWREWHQPIYDPARDRESTLGRHLANRNALEAARYHVHRQVNTQLRGHVSPSVLPFLDGAIRLFPDSLAAAVWLRFAFELSGGSGRQRECEHCHQPFAVRRRDQRFCGKNCQEASAYRRRIAMRRLGRTSSAESQSASHPRPRSLS